MLPIRIILADDHPLIRTGIRTALAAVPRLSVVGEATDGTDAVRACRSLRPDVLVLDLNMPGTPSLAVVHTLRAELPQLKIVVLTAYDDDVYVRGMIGAGVAGYVLKDEATESLVRAIDTVMAGGQWFSHMLMQRLAQPSIAAVPQPRPWTEREQQLLHMIARGWDNTRISQELNLAEQTVRNYISRLYIAIGVASRGEAVVWARQNGFG